MITLLGRKDGGSATELLARALRETCGMEQMPQLARTEEGKPWIPGQSSLHFNLSHSGEYALCALGETPLGVDVEVVRPRRDRLTRYVLSDREYTWFEERGSRWEDFYTLWTLKESRCKYTGRGLDMPPRELAVPLLEPGEPGELEGLSFRAYGGEGWRAALCAAAPCALPECICWVWQ